MKYIKILITFFLTMSLFGCQVAKEPYSQVELTASELKEKIDNKETFNFMVIRDGCDFCESLYTYIDETKEEHAGVVLYTIDITDFDFSKIEEDSKMLQSDTEDGQYLLSLCPYFLYTPSIYKVEEGVITTSGIGFSDTKKTVSIWPLDSTIDFDTAETVNFWDFIE